MWSCVGATAGLSSSVVVRRCHCWLAQQCDRAWVPLLACPAVWSCVGATAGLSSSVVVRYVYGMTNSRLQHRKQVRHYHDPGHCHELTFSCFERRPLLTNDHWRALFSVAVERATLRHDYDLTAFVYMPEHVHLLVRPGPDASTIDRLLFAIKRPFSFRIKQELERSNASLLKQLMIRQRPGVETFRYWQKVPGYDRNLDRAQTVLTAIDYIHRNPVRRGLVERSIDWQWSSARWHEGLPNDSRVTLPKLKRLPAEFLVSPAR